ncbi:VOC family protein [Kribbella sp. NPDC051770]|uniref:VOC family protein n=1 Tax=Kribbella sp. NPDC051770 TaxID=3155413 RepID=UPI003443E2AA
MIYELNHVGGPVQDLDASLDFYTALGAEIVDHLFMAGPQVTRVHLQLGTGLIELLHANSPAPDATYGLNHVGFMTDNLDADYARLIEAGYAELSPPKVAGSGQGRLAFLADPNGHRVELLQRTEEFRVPPITTGETRRLAHIALDAPDLEAATTFYSEHLGLPHDSGRFTLNQDTLALSPTWPPSTTPVNHLALEVTTPRPDLHDPDGNRITFVPVS